MAELDHPGHMPEGLDEHVWQRLVQARRMKVESEQKVCIMLNCYVQIVDVLLNISLHQTILLPKTNKGTFRIQLALST